MACYDIENYDEELTDYLRLILHGLKLNLQKKFPYLTKLKLRKDAFSGIWIYNICL